MTQSSAYFAPLVPLPVIIVEPGMYRTRSGEVVRVSVAKGSASGWSCIGQYANGEPECWHRSGRLLASGQTANDIVEHFP